MVSWLLARNSFQCLPPRAGQTRQYNLSADGLNCISQFERSRYLVNCRYLKVGIKPVRNEVPENTTPEGTRPDCTPLYQNLQPLPAILGRTRLSLAQIKRLCVKQVWMKQIFQFLWRVAKSARPRRRSFQTNGHAPKFNPLPTVWMGRDFQKHKLSRRLKLHEISRGISINQRSGEQRVMLKLETFISNQQFINA